MAGSLSPDSGELAFWPQIEVCGLGGAKPGYCSLVAEWKMRAGKKPALGALSYSKLGSSRALHVTHINTHTYIYIYIYMLYIYN